MDYLTAMAHWISFDTLHQQKSPFTKWAAPTGFAKTSAVGSVLQEPSYQIDVWLSLNPLTPAFPASDNTAYAVCAVLGANCHVLDLKNVKISDSGL